MYKAVQVSLEGRSKLLKILFPFTSAWWVLEKAYPWALCFWLLHHGSITGAAAGNFQETGGNQLQDFFPKGGLIPTGMPIADTPTVSILAGVHWEGKAEAQPRRRGIEKGMGAAANQLCKWMLH